MRMKELFHKVKQSYSTKLILIFTLLNLMSILIISILFYFMLSNIMYKNYEKVTQDVSSQIHTEIYRKIDEMKRITNLYLFDQNFFAVIRKKYEGLERQNILNDYLLTKGNTSLVLSDLPVSIKLYLENDTIPEHYYTNGSDNSRPQRMSFEVMHLSKIEDADYYKQFEQEDSNIVLRQVDTDIEENCISMISKIMNFTTSENAGMLRLRIGIDALLGEAVHENIKQELNYEVTDCRGKLLFCYNPDYTFHKSDFAAEQTIEEWGLTIRLFMPKQNISNGFWISYLNIILAAMVCFVLILIFVLLFKKRVYGDISKILKGINEFQLGNYEYNIETLGDDEFSQISTSLNRFAHSTGHLVNDVYEVMVQKQDLEFQMLQAKVNPHFLYNIFSIISQMAQAGRNDEIVSIVDKTAKFYRSVLSKKNETGSIRGEIDILNQYLEIIEIQRPGAVAVQYEIEEAMLDCEIPKFTFQPIVENSIKHAMVDGKLHVKIMAHYDHQKDMVEIVISDDGIGMTAEQVEELFRVRENRGYGLYNISERIRLRYQEGKYDIKCVSRPGEGTDIILTIPFEVSEEEVY